MGALPNRLDTPSPTSPRKAPTRARTLEKKCAPRTREELEQRHAAGSEPEKGTGWSPLYRVIAVAFHRLVSGATFASLFLHLQGEAQRDRRDEKQDAKSREVEVSIAELAILFGVTERSVNSELEMMERRELAIVKRLAGGRAVVRLVLSPERIGSKTYPGWTAVSQVSYADWRKQQEAAAAPPAEDQPDETPEDEAPKVNPGTVAITKAPVSVRAGHRSRSIPLNVGVRKLRFDWDTANKVDVQFSAVVTSGELILTGKLPDFKLGDSKKDANRTESASSKKSSGSILPNSASIPPNAGSVPRGEELAKVFDSILLDKLGKSLSSDFETLKEAAAIIAAAEVSPEYLESFASERAKRKISTVRHVVQICRECASNWPKMKGKPVPTAQDTSRSKSDERAEQVIRGLKMFNEIRRRSKKL